MNARFMLIALVAALAALTPVVGLAATINPIVVNKPLYKNMVMILIDNSTLKGRPLVNITYTTPSGSTVTINVAAINVTYNGKQYWMVLIANESDSGVVYTATQSPSFANTPIYNLTEGTQLNLSSLYAAGKLHTTWLVYWNGALVEENVTGWFNTSKGLRNETVVNVISVKPGTTITVTIYNNTFANNVGSTQISVGTSVPLELVKVYAMEDSGTYLVPATGAAKVALRLLATDPTAYFYNNKSKYNVICVSAGTPLPKVGVIAVATKVLEANMLNGTLLVRSATVYPNRYGAYNITYAVEGNYTCIIPVPRVENVGYNVYVNVGGINYPLLVNMTFNASSLSRVFNPANVTLAVVENTSKLGIYNMTIEVIPANKSITAYYYKSSEKAVFNVSSSIIKELAGMTFTLQVGSLQIPFKVAVTNATISGEPISPGLSINSVIKLVDLDANIRPWASDSANTLNPASISVPGTKATIPPSAWVDENDGTFVVKVVRLAWSNSTSRVEVQNNELYIYISPAATYKKFNLTKATINITYTDNITTAGVPATKTFQIPLNIKPVTVTVNTPTFVPGEAVTVTLASSSLNLYGGNVPEVLMVNTSNGNVYYAQSITLNPVTGTLVANGYALIGKLSVVVEFPNGTQKTIPISSVLNCSSVKTVYFGNMKQTVCIATEMNNAGEYTIGLNSWSLAEYGNESKFYIKFTDYLAGGAVHEAATMLLIRPVTFAAKPAPAVTATQVSSTSYAVTIPVPIYTTGYTPSTYAGLTYNLTVVFNNPNIIDLKYVASEYKNVVVEVSSEAGTCRLIAPLYKVGEYKYAAWVTITPNLEGALLKSITITTVVNKTGCTISANPSYLYSTDSITLKYTPFVGAPTYTVVAHFTSGKAKIVVTPNPAPITSNITIKFIDPDLAAILKQYDYYNKTFGLKLINMAKFESNPPALQMVIPVPPAINPAGSASLLVKTAGNKLFKINSTDGSLEFSGSLFELLNSTMNQAIKAPTLQEYEMYVNLTKLYLGGKSMSISYIDPTPGLGNLPAVETTVSFTAHKATVELKPECSVPTIWCNYTLIIKDADLAGLGKPTTSNLVANVILLTGKFGLPTSMVVVKPVWVKYNADLNTYEIVQAPVRQVALSELFSKGYLTFNTEASNVSNGTYVFTLDVPAWLNNMSDAKLRDTVATALASLVTMSGAGTVKYNPNVSFWYPASFNVTYYDISSPSGTTTDILVKGATKLYLASISVAPNPVILSKETPTKVIVNVTDYDANVRPYVADSVPVIVRNPMTGQVVVVQLTETAPNSGKFSGSFYVTANPNQATTNILYVNTTTTKYVTVEYIDVISPEGIAKVTARLNVTVTGVVLRPLSLVEQMVKSHELKATATLSTVTVEALGKKYSLLQLNLKLENTGKYDVALVPVIYLVNASNVHQVLVSHIPLPVLDPMFASSVKANLEALYKAGVINDVVYEALMNLRNTGLLGIIAPAGKCVQYNLTLVDVSLLGLLNQLYGGKTIEVKAMYVLWALGPTTGAAPVITNVTAPVTLLVNSTGVYIVG